MCRHEIRETAGRFDKCADRLDVQNDVAHRTFAAPAFGALRFRLRHALAERRLELLRNDRVQALGENAHQVACNLSVIGVLVADTAGGQRRLPKAAFLRPIVENRLRKIRLILRDGTCVSTRVGITRHFEQEAFERLEVFDRHALARKVLGVEQRRVSSAQHPSHLSRRGAATAWPERNPSASRPMHDRAEAERPRPLPGIHRLAERLAHRGCVRRSFSHAVPLDLRTQALHCAGVFAKRRDYHLVDGGLGECRIVGVGKYGGLPRSRERDEKRKGHDSCPRPCSDGRAASWPDVCSGSRPP